MNRLDLSGIVCDLTACKSVTGTKTCASEARPGERGLMCHCVQLYWLSLGENRQHRCIVRFTWTSIYWSRWMYLV